jgi:hypothetical protein
MKQAKDIHEKERDETFEVRRKKREDTIGAFTRQPALHTQTGHAKPLAFGKGQPREH